MTHISSALSIDMTRISTETDDEEEDKGLGREREMSQSPEIFLGGVSDMSHDLDQSEMINMSTLSAPEVSLVPSPDVSMVRQFKKKKSFLSNNNNESFV